MMIQLVAQNAHIFRVQIWPSAVASALKQEIRENQQPNQLSIYLTLGVCVYVYVFLALFPIWIVNRSEFALLKRPINISCANAFKRERTSLFLAIFGMPRLSCAMIIV